MDGSLARVESVLEALFGKPRAVGPQHGGAYLFGSIAGFSSAIITNRLSKRLAIDLLPRLGLSFYSSPLAAGLLYVAFFVIFGGMGAVPGLLVGRLIDKRSSTETRVAMERCVEIAALTVLVALVGVYARDLARGAWFSGNIGLAVLSAVGLAFLLEPTGSRLRRLLGLR
jgi:hypothetical protein